MSLGLLTFKVLSNLKSKSMAQIVFKQGELLRISPQNRRELEVSTNKGRSWHTRFAGGSICGDFLSLVWVEEELMAQTSRGLYYSKDQGRSWMRRS